MTVRLTTVPLMLALALASYHLVETPLRRHGHRLAEGFARPAAASGRATAAD
jgi:peptidoglycan/LPS O-acetylase OafA/YrhL